MSWGLIGGMEAESSPLRPAQVGRGCPPIENTILADGDFNGQGGIRTRGRAYSPTPV